MSGADLMLIAPPLALLLLAAAACVWVALGDRDRRERQAELAAALRPRSPEMGPSTHGAAPAQRPRSAKRTTDVPRPLTERSLR